VRGTRAAERRSPRRPGGATDEPTATGSRGRCVAGTGLSWGTVWNIGFHDHGTRIGGEVLGVDSSMRRRSGRQEGQARDMGRERHRRLRRRLPGLARNRRRSLTFAFLDASVARREVGAAATRGDGAAARGGGQRCRVAVSAGAPRRPGARERPVCIGGGRFRGRERGRRANSTGARVRPLPVGGSPRRPLLHRRGDGESVPVRVCQDGDTRTCQDGGTLAPGAAPSDARMPRASQGPRRIGGGKKAISGRRRQLHPGTNPSAAAGRHQSRNHGHCHRHQRPLLQDRARLSRTGPHPRRPRFSGPQRV